MSRWGRLGLAVLALCSLGCNEVSFLIPGPEIRGITIPLPPPSITAEPVVRVDFEGQLGNGAVPDRTKVLLYERRSARGFYSFAEDSGDWFIPDVRVDVTDNCVAVHSVDETGEESVREYYKLQLRESAECVPGCTQPDDEGNCVCFEQWSTGC